MMMIALHIPVCSYLYNRASLTVGTLCSARLFWTDIYMCTGVKSSQNEWEKKNTFLVSVFLGKKKPKCTHILEWGLKIFQWEWPVHQDVPLASCMEIHPHWVVQIMSFKLQLAHAKERCAGAQLKHPQGFSTLAKLSPPSAVTATGWASPGLQTWERKDQFHSNIESKESDGAMDLCPKYSYKNHSGFSLSRRFFGGCFVSYVAMCNSLSVAICTWACTAWSRKPHPHTQKNSGNLDIYIFASSELWLIQQNSHYSTCKQTSWEMSRIRDGKREMPLRRPWSCNQLQQSSSP